MTELQESIGVHCWLRLKRHRWRLLAVDPLLITTNLLYGCDRCRRVRTKRVVGQWEPRHGGYPAGGKKASDLGTPPIGPAEAAMVGESRTATQRRVRHKPSSVAERRQIKMAVCERDGWRCQLCGVDVDLHPVKPNAKNAATLDHVIPFAEGGPFTVENLRLLCFPCNHRRGMVRRG